MGRMSIRRPPSDQTPIRTDAALTRCWQQYLATEPFRFRALWLLFLDGRGRPRGPVMTIDDLPDGPYEMDHQDLVELCRGILEGPGGGGSVAMLMSRSGALPWTVSDRAWGRFLLRAVDELDGAAWPIHQAHRRGLVKFELPGVEQHDQRVATSA
jgi:hypothetical protein